MIITHLLPRIDASMRELWQTGWCQQNIRMAAASFLIEYCSLLLKTDCVIRILKQSWWVFCRLTDVLTVLLEERNSCANPCFAVDHKGQNMLIITLSPHFPEVTSIGSRVQNGTRNLGTPWFQGARVDSIAQLLPTAGFGIPWK